MFAWGMTVVPCAQLKHVQQEKKAVVLYLSLDILQVNYSFEVLMFVENLQNTIQRYKEHCIM